MGSLQVRVLSPQDRCKLAPLVEAPGDRLLFAGSEAYQANLVSSDLASRFPGAFAKKPAPATKA